VDFSTYIAQHAGDNWSEKRRVLLDSFLREGVHISRAANLQDEDESPYFKICFAIEKEVLIKGLKRFVTMIIPADYRLARALNLKHDSVETPLSKEDVGTDQLVEELVKRLLAEHDRSPRLGSAGVVGSSDHSSGDEKGSDSVKLPLKRTSPRVARKRREFVLLQKTPETSELNETEMALNETQTEERGLEL
jgi:hypothetical protein